MLNFNQEYTLIDALLEKDIANELKITPEDQQKIVQIKVFCEEQYLDLSAVYIYMIKAMSKLVYCNKYTELANLQNTAIIQKMMNIQEVFKSCYLTRSIFSGLLPRHPRRE